jgi:hypothetical protein
MKNAKKLKLHCSCQRHESIQGEDTAPPILNIDDRWDGCQLDAPGALHPRKYLNRPRAGLDVSEKRKISPTGIQTPDRLACS